MKAGRYGLIHLVHAKREFLATTKRCFTDVSCALEVHAEAC